MHTSINQAIIGYVVTQLQAGNLQCCEKLGFNEEELAAFLRDATLKYDHIYYVDSIPGCGNAKPYNHEILNTYPMVRVLGGEKYLTPTERPAKVYKIK